LLLANQERLSIPDPFIECLSQPGVLMFQFVLSKLGNLFTPYCSIARCHNSSRLMLSSNKPHGPASVPTIGRWIKEQLKITGIDTSIITAHSTRGVAASKAVFLVYRFKLSKTPAIGPGSLRQAVLPQRVVNGPTNLISRSSPTASLNAG
jgi:hypothetical protein